MTEEKDAFGDRRGITAQSLTAKMPVGRFAAFYNFAHKNRGIALIFNHEYFAVEHHNLPPRAGTNLDCERLTNSLQLLDFNVSTFKDFRYHEIDREISKASKMNHSNSDCIMVIILSHGEMGLVYAYDCQYQVDSLWKPFTADKCPSLAGKPKLFFLQACQGDIFDAGVTLVKKIETDGHANFTYRIPTYADFLIAYSTVPGHFSWRNTKNGSWFIQALCHELDKNAKKYDILTLLTFVCQTVAFDYESNVPSNLQMHEMKQMPCVTTMLTRLLQFNDKN